MVCYIPVSVPVKFFFLVWAGLGQSVSLLSSLDEGPHFYNTSRK
jgi:hypothetical protein